MSELLSIVNIEKRVVNELKSKDAREEAMKV